MREVTGADPAVCGIETRGLSVRYGGTRALDDVGFRAAPGQVTALLGPNGSGKSTALRALAGLVRYEGDVARPARHLIGYMPQDTSSRVALTVLEAVLLGRLGRLGLRLSADDLGSARRVLDELGIADLSGRYLGELSGGQRQMVFLAQSLISDPVVLLLDEPVSALDIRHGLEVLETVRRLTLERRLTTLLVLHDLNAAARYADKLVLLKEGRVAVSGSVRDVLTDMMLAQVFEVEGHVDQGRDGLPLVTVARSLRRSATPAA